MDVEQAGGLCGGLPPGGDSFDDLPHLRLGQLGLAPAPAALLAGVTQAGACALADPALRRRSNAGLNKGEARNALARAVFFHRLGEVRDRTFENQCYRASGLNLVVAAIILWNTVYLGRAVDALRDSGNDVPDDLLAHVAPLGWEHISLTGDYVWDTPDTLKGSFRPLRTGPSPFLRVA